MLTKIYLHLERENAKNLKKIGGEVLIVDMANCTFSKGCQW